MSSLADVFRILNRLQDERLVAQYVPVRVVDPDHLVALALQAGGARRRERAWQLLETGAVDRERLRRILMTHAIAAEIPDDA